MGNVVTSPCVGLKDGACAKVCPVNCFYDAGDMLVIQKEECICCQLCVPECPVGAIFEEGEVPVNLSSFITHAESFFAAKSHEELETLRVHN